MTPKRPSRRNPNDVTFRNQRAMSKRVDALERQVRALLKGYRDASRIRPMDYKR